MRVEVLKTEGYRLLAEVRVGDQILAVVDDFSMMPPEHLRKAKPEFSYIGVEGYSWEQMFSGNPHHEKKLVRTGDWSYDAYGQIVSTKLVLADFGLITSKWATSRTTRDVLGNGLWSGWTAWS